MMGICASLVLVLVWSIPGKFTVINQLAMTSFIIGLASFLVWIVTMIFEIRDRIDKK